MKYNEGQPENTTGQETQVNENKVEPSHDEDTPPFKVDAKYDLSEYIEKFPTGLSRKDALNRNRKDIEAFKKHGNKLIRKNLFYTWTDSPLDLEGTNQEPIRSAFLDVIPTKDKSIRSYIEDSLNEKYGEAIGIEFGGIGSAAFSEFTPGFFKKSLAVTLVDHRNKSIFDGANTRRQDRKINHSVIKADILDDSTYNAIDREIDGAKVDLIIERMAKGLEFIPPEPYLAMKILQKWYGMLAEGGLMFVQTPVIFNELLVKWEKLIRETCPEDVLEFTCQFGMEDKLRTYCSSIRIRKLAGAPEKLPVLDYRTVADTGMSKDLARNKKWEQDHASEIFNKYN